MSFKGEFPLRPFRELWPPLVQQWPKRPAFHLDMACPCYMSSVPGVQSQTTHCGPCLQDNHPSGDQKQKVIPQRRCNCTPQEGDTAWGQPHQTHGRGSECGIHLTSAWVGDGKARKAGWDPNGRDPGCPCTQPTPARTQQGISEAIRVWVPSRMRGVEGADGNRLVERCPHGSEQGRGG